MRVKLLEENFDHDGFVEVIDEDLSAKMINDFDESHSFCQLDNNFKIQNNPIYVDMIMMI